jgi:hypothetical protein
MNTNLTTTTTIRTTAFAACLIALIAAGTACGTGDGTATAPAAIARPGTSDSFSKSNRADQEEYLRQLEAKRDRLQSHRYGDDRRQANPADRSRSSHPTRPQGSQKYPDLLP